MLGYRVHWNEGRIEAVFADNMLGLYPSWTRAAQALLTVQARVPQSLIAPEAKPSYAEYFDRWGCG